MNGHRNSLGLIRLILASLVIIDHAFPLGGFGEDPLLFFSNSQATLGSLAVGGFFAISGYLITKSGTSGDVVQFMWKRAIRIYPAYWLVLVVTAFLVAPVVWVTSGQPLDKSFFAGPNGPFQYIYSNWTLNIGSFGVHDIFANSTPWGKPIMNGSLWTLIYEWNSYLIIGVLVTFGILTKARFVVPMIAIIFFILLIFTEISGNLPNQLTAELVNYSPMIQMGFFFMIGSVFAAYSNEVTFDDRIGLFSGFLLIASLRFGGFSTIGSVAFVYFVLYLAARLPKKLHWVGQKNDYSYGVYIYGFLIQQFLAYMGVYKWGFFSYVVLSWIAAMCCAWLSWHLIEKRVLSLKHWGPGKGFTFWTLRVRTNANSRY